MDYKEKLMLAKEALNSGSYDKETIEYIFPELKESEDERIRKELLDYLMKFIPHNDLDLVRKSKVWIAWLEKQGEIVKWHEDELDICACKYFDKGYKSALEKQGEQKPVIIIPKFRVGECIRYRGENYEIKDIEKTKDSFIYNVSIIGKPSDPEEVKTAIGFAAEQDMVKIEHPSWSEEDRKRLDRIQMVLESWDRSHTSLTGLPSTIPDDINWLKSLKERIQPKQEWSEFDYNMMNAIICLTKQGRHLEEEHINWLKSLKPKSHWKPSEEQMQALFEAKLASTKNREYFLGLLYEDLKKL